MWELLAEHFHYIHSAQAGCFTTRKLLLPANFQLAIFGISAKVPRPKRTGIDLHKRGALGGYSGVAADVLLARTLQRGDPNDVVRSVLSDFPNQAIVRQIVREYFVSGGIPREKAYKRVPGLTLTPSPLTMGLLVCATYAGIRLSSLKAHNLFS